MNCLIVNRSISFVRSIATSSKLVFSIINHSRKPLLFDKKSAWVKKGNKYLLGAEIGSYNGAETCGLVGLSMLNRLGTVN